jgi:cell division protein FtsB
LGNPSYKRNLEALFRSVARRWRISAVARRTGYILISVLAIAYGLAALRGPQGVSALLDKRREVQQLQQENSAKAAENERRRERIQRLKQNTTEQEMEIRKKLKLLRPGETTFILPDSPNADGKPNAPPN